MAVCESLDPIGCSDDVIGCGDGKNSDLCVTGLVPGETYYITLAAKTDVELGIYRLTIEAPCTPTDERPANDLCIDAEPVAEGRTPFDLANATFTCPLPTCLQTGIDDVWYEWTAPADGVIKALDGITTLEEVMRTTRDI